MPADSITLPNGCSIYALFVTGYAQNPDLDQLIFYKAAKFITENNGYVHFAWWNNIMREYMAGPAHDFTVNIPLLGTFGPTPGGLIGVHAVGFAPLNFVAATTLFPKALPEEDHAFQADAQLMLAAIRAHNPNAVIVVAGHSMGGEAVARLGTDTNIDIDLLAPIDPAGNRTRPVGMTTNRTYNWTRWRAAQSSWGGFKQADCIRGGGLFGLSCKNFGTFFNPEYRCEPDGYGPPLDEPPLIPSRAPLHCPGPWIAAGDRRTLRANIRHLLHRWQKEFMFPFDYNSNQPFVYQGRDTTSVAGPVVPAQAGLDQNGLFENDRQKTCGTVLKEDPRDHTLNCSPTDGHGEIIGSRGGDRIGSQARNWPTTPEGRRAALIEMATAAAPDEFKDSTGPHNWDHEPLNPHLDFVVTDMIKIIEVAMRDREIEEPADTTPPVTVAELDPSANDAGWHNRQVDVALSASDSGGSGVQHIEHTLTGAQTGGAVTPGSSAATLVTQEGTTTLAYHATDNDENVEAAQTVKIKLDLTPPTISTALDPAPNANGWNRTPVTVSFETSDALSGLAATPAPVDVSNEGAEQEIVGSAEDQAGNQAATSAIVNIDVTPPTISALVEPPANASGWNRTNVTVTFPASDALSGLASSPNPVELSNEGAAQEVAGTAQDNAGNESAVSAIVSIDRTAPGIAITSPAANAVFLLNAAATADFDCADGLSGLTACIGSVADGEPLDTASVGSKEVSVSAADVAGNTNTARHTYAVHYVFSGFAPPIRSLPTVNIVKAGSTVPVKYALADANGAPVTNLASFVSLVSTPVACDADTFGDLTEGSDAEGPSDTIWFADGLFRFNWKTTTGWTGCRVLALTLNDGSRHEAVFQFRAP